MNKPIYVKDESIQSIITHYTTCLTKKEMEFDEIRPQLKAEGLDESLIKYIISSVDDATQQYDLQESGGRKNFKFTSSGFGTILSLIGVLLLIPSLLGAERVQGLDIGGYSLIFMGLSVIFIRKVKVRTAKFRNENKFLNDK